MNSYTITCIAIAALCIALALGIGVGYLLGIVLASKKDLTE